MDGQRVPRPARRRERITSKAYRELLRAIELEQVWLQEAHFRNLAGPSRPEDAQLDITIGVRWDTAGGGFVASSKYDVRVHRGEDLLVEMTAIFSASFRCDQMPGDAFFEEFAGVNLQVILWPYLRQWISDTLARAGWQPLTIPTYKVGVGPGVTPAFRRGSAPPATPGAEE